ncbi:gamma-glutamylcyclotransferase family protein [Methanolobus sp. WCC4]|uniref:gamma-glutamylcyclotransferase family protein n=1 Tax=Methanolobus sp. WCC4 TaxID=3125784 RepID=UPI0030F92667
MYIFVYGTLKKDSTNHYLLNGSEFICSTGTKESYTMLDMGQFPGVLKDELPEGHSASIQGEVYDVNEQTLGKLDTYEGDWYFREEVELEAGVTALMYFLRKIPPLDYRIVPEGNWTGR